MNDLELSILIPDSHVPYEDKRAFKLLFKVMNAYKSQIKEIAILGDFGDYYAVTGHGKAADMQHPLIEEIDAINKYLDYFEKSFPKAKKVFIEGNHEYRLARYIEKTCPAIFGVTDTPQLLRLDQRPNFKYVPYGPIEKVMPYLFRRAQENTSVAGQSGRELELIVKEIRRRRKN